MSDIVIEGKNIKDITQSNFQSVGPYTDSNNTQVKEPWQGRDIVNGENQDKRFELGTYTENNREFWEIQTIDTKSGKSQFSDKKTRTARAYVREDNNLVISDETDWSVDSFPYTKDKETGETIPLYFYYDKDLHSNEYKSAVMGKVNLKIELRESGRDNESQEIDNFLFREPFRPFTFGFSVVDLGEGEASGEPFGAGAFNFGDSVTIEIAMEDDSYLDHWSSDAVTIPNATSNPTTFIMPKADFEVIANVRNNPIIQIVARTNGTVDETAANVTFWKPDVGIVKELIPITNNSYWAKFFNNGQNPNNQPAYNTDIIYNANGANGASVPLGTTRGTFTAAFGDFATNSWIVTDHQYDSYNSNTSDPEHRWDIIWSPNVSDEIIAASTGSEFQVPTIKTTTLQNSTIRPTEVITIAAARQDTRYEFENFSYIDIDGVEQPISSSFIDVPLGLIGLGDNAEADLTIPVATTEILTQPDYPDGLKQIYANYFVQLYQIINFNAWKDSTPSSIQHRLQYGYGDVLVGPPDDLDNIFETKQLPLNSELQIVAKPGWKQDVGQLGGYVLGYFFYWNNLSGVSHTAIVDTLDLDQQEILDTRGSVTGGDFISFNNDQNQNNSITNQLIRTPNSEEDSVNYLGHVFKPTGTYVKITKTDDSHDFNIVRPAGSYIVRDKENSPELDANMYSIGSILSWTFTPNMVHTQGEVGEMPIIQSIKKWDDEANELITETDISTTLDNFGITYEQDGESMKLRYPLADTNEEELYLKYLEFIVKSTIVPPPLDPFLGVFEVNFNSNSENLGTISLLQEADEIPQTTIIGLFGADAGQFGVETPTHAINMDDWIAGATVGILPIPLDIDVNSNDTDLTSLTANLSPNFETRVDEILEDNVFDNYDADLKSSIKEHLVNEYLNLQITDNNSFSIEPNTSNEAVREFLRVVEQNNNLPRLPLRVTGTFSQTFVLTLNPFEFLNSNNNVTYPTKFITNWDQSAYNANSSLSAADTWLNDDLLEVEFADMSDSTFQIAIPATFFNGSRQIKIIQQIAPQSDANAGFELFYTGASDPTLYSNELGTFKWRHRIVDMDSSSTISLSWVGGF